MNKFNPLHWLILTLFSAMLMQAPATWAEANVEPEITKVDVNTATTKELRKLAGIGRAKAGAIVAWRSENGDFKTTDDLLKVPGLGASTILRNDAAFGLPTGEIDLTSRLSTKQKARLQKNLEKDQAKAELKNDLAMLDTKS